MQKLLRIFLIGMLISTLAEGPGLAAPSQPLGVVLQAENAQLGAGEAVIGSTVFNGDSLATGLNGNLSVRVGRAQLYLPENSSATVRGAFGGVNVTLQSGTLFFSSEDAGVVEVSASEVVIRSRRGQPVYVKVKVSGPNELEIVSYRGTLDVTAGDDTRAVTEKTAYRVLTEPEGSDQGGAAPAGHRRGKFIAILFFAAATAVAIAIARIYFGSPDRP